jgi:hypothetical protein
MISFDNWRSERRKAGTLERLARHASVNGYDYRSAISSFKYMLLAEMFLACGGSLTALSEKTGIHKNSISRLLRSSGLEIPKLRKMLQDLSEKSK